MWLYIPKLIYENVTIIKSKKKNLLFIDNKCNKDV